PLRAAGPHRAERFCKCLRRLVAGAGEGIDAAALPGRDLRQNVRGGAESVEAEGPWTRAFGVGPGRARHAIAAPADQARTQERRNLRIVAPFGKRETVARIGDRMGGVAAIARIAGKCRPIAQILPTSSTVGADAAGGAEPRHTDALAQRQPFDPCPERRDAADDFVAG